jgi:dipeptidyl aminopeptidase/acylaminoacyl peptidase
MARLLILLCSLVSLAALAEPAPPPPPLPVEYFTRDDLTGRLKISPDGKHFAIIVGRLDASALVFLDVATGAVVGGVRGGKGKEIHDFHWISPSRVVYQIAERQLGVRYASLTGEFFAIDVDGKANRIIYGYRAGEFATGTQVRRREASNAAAELVSVLRGDEKHILIAEYPYRLRGNTWHLNRDAKPEITRLNVYDGRKTSLGTAPLANARVIVDGNDHVRFAVGFDENATLRASWRPEADGPWQSFALPGFIEDSVLPLRFTADQKAVLFSAIAEAESVSGLYRIELETQEIQELYKHPEFDIDRLVPDLLDEKAVGVQVYTDRPEIHWLEPEDPSAKLLAKLARAFPGQAVRITSTTSDGSLAIVFAYSDTNPGDYYVFDIKAGRANYAKASEDWVDPDLMRPKEPIRFAARDGLPLHGYLTRPHAGDGPYPLVILPHGGPHGVRDRWGYDWEVQLLANRGYAVLQVNFRGSEGYGRHFEAAGFGEWGARMQDDLTDATHWAIEQGIASADRICIFGSSYGGYAALMGAVREPELYRCVVGHAGAYDLELMYSTGDIRHTRLGQSYLGEVLGNDKSLLRARSPAHNAERIEVPVLLVHGTDDSRVDYKHAAQMRRALEQHGKVYEWIALRGEGHGITDEASRAEVYTSILAFLDRHLKEVP